MLAEKLNMSSEDAEKWIVNLIRNARLDAKIDSQLVSISTTLISTTLISTTLIAATLIPTTLIAATLIFTTLITATINNLITCVSSSCSDYTIFLTCCIKMFYKVFYKT